MIQNIQLIVILLLQGFILARYIYIYTYILLSVLHQSGEAAMPGTGVALRQA